MFPKMRRKNQILPEEMTWRILEEGSDGVLSLHGTDGYPYGVPVNYHVQDGKIYIHGARSGHKIDAIKADNRASFCVVAENEVVKEEYTTYYRSVIAFGRVNIIEEEEARRKFIRALSLKFYPEADREELEEKIDQDLPPMIILEMEIDHITGKQNWRMFDREKSYE